MDSLPPPTLRLLPAGTTSCRVGITPTENPNLFTTHTLKGLYMPAPKLDLFHSSRYSPRPLIGHSAFGTDCHSHPTRRKEARWSWRRNSIG